MINKIIKIYQTQLRNANVSLEKIIRNSLIVSNYLYYIMPLKEFVRFGQDKLGGAFYDKEITSAVIKDFLARKIE